MKLVLTVVSYTCCTLGLIQAIVVLCLYKVKSHCVVKRRPHFSISVVVADALLAVTSIAQKLLLTYTNVKEPTLHVLSVVLFFCSDIFLAAGQWSQLAFVVDRFTAVRFPMQHKLWLPKHRMKYALMGIWATITIFGVTSMALAGAKKSYFIANLLMVIIEVAPAHPSLILFLWIQKLVCHARFESRKLTGTASPQSLFSRVLESRKNLVLSAMMSVVTTCGWPAYRLGFVICMNKCNPNAKIVGQYLLLFGYISMLFDPWVYALIPRICFKKCYYFCKGRSDSDTRKQTQSMTLKSSKIYKSDTLVSHI